MASRCYYIFPTVITNDQQRLKKNFTILAGALNDDEIGVSIPGFHLEGPYISPIQGFRGAHLEKYIRQPEWDEFSELQKAAGNRILMITLAPEAKGAIPFIRKCSASGVIALGHHNGSAESRRCRRFNVDASWKWLCKYDRPAQKSIVAAIGR